MTERAREKMRDQSVDRVKEDGETKGTKIGHGLFHREGSLSV